MEPLRKWTNFIRTNLNCFKKKGPQVHALDNLQCLLPQVNTHEEVNSIVQSSFIYGFVPESEIKNRFSAKLNSDDGKKLLESELGYREVIELGSGCFGTAFSVQVKNDNDDLVVGQSKSVRVCKTYLFGREFEQHLHDNFVMEASLYRQISHANIVQFYGCFQLYCNSQDEWNITKINHENKLNLRTHSRLLMSGLLLEQMEMTLQNWLLKYQIWGLSEAFIGELFDQLGPAFVYLHKHLHICHCDIKEDNFGVVKDLGRDRFPHIKLYDFSISHQYTHDVYLDAEQHSARFATCNNPIELNEVIEPNAFLSESYNFANFVMKLFACGELISFSSSPLDMSSFPGSNRQAFERRSRGWKNVKLRNILLRMVPKTGLWDFQQLVSLSWAMDAYERM